MCKKNMNKKIMIIDDSNTIRKTARLFLKELEYEVIEVDDGYNALTQIIDNYPDLILVDIMMPKLGGYETCTIIKQNPDFENLPIILLSSKDGILDKAKGKLYGCDDYLTKPFSKTALFDIVKKYLK